MKVLLDGRQPEALLVGEVVASPLGPVALDEGRGAEVLQTGAGGYQRLAATFAARRRVLGKAREVGSEP